MPMRHRVMNDMTIGATMVVLLFRSLYGLHRLVDNGALVLQWPHDIRSDGGEERKTERQRTEAWESFL